MKTRNFRISQNTHFDYQTKKQIDCGFDYNQSASLKMDYNMEKIAEFINEVAQLDNPPKYNMTFSIKEQEKAKKEVMSEAYNKAKEKAEIIAISAGKTLKDCVKVDFRPFTNDYVSNTMVGNEMMYAEKYMKGAVQSIANNFTPEEIELTETLYCLWIAE